MEALISIVVPSFNQRAYVAQTLQSLLDQRDPALEIIVVDGGSTDGSVEEIRRFEKHIAWWESERDSGQSNALNKGFARARGEWLGWLNSDDLLLPGALRTLRDHIAGEPAREWWIGGGHFIDEAGRPFRPFTAPRGLSSPHQLHDWAEFWFAQPSTFFSRALFQRAGGRIREDLHYAMDLDLWLRFLAICEPGAIDAELSIYRHHSAGKTESASVNGEAEIVRVLVEHLGIEGALGRVRSLARERNALRLASGRWERLVGPALGVYRKVRDWRRADAAKEQR